MRGLMALQCRSSSTEYPVPSAERLNLDSSVPCFAWGRNDKVLTWYSVLGTGN
jgi:hypothetical protein